ncbi:Head fiber protein [Geosporobacter ferrireducens]|nr:Head fiber protein [Geosporobacter ferrireducens]
MMSYNTKNYTEQGGEKTVIGGELVIEEEAKVTGLPVLESQPASTAATVEDLVADFNALLTKLKATGLMVEDTP